MIDPRDITIYPVDLALGAGSTPIMTPPAGHRWAVVSGFLGVVVTGGQFVVLSGATAITGTITLVAPGLTLGAGAQEYVWVARATGDALNIDPATQDIDGWLGVVILK